MKIKLSTFLAKIENLIKEKSEESKKDLLEVFSAYLETQDNGFSDLKVNQSNVSIKLDVIESQSLEIKETTTSLRSESNQRLSDLSDDVEEVKTVVDNIANAIDSNLNKSSSARSASYIQRLQTVFQEEFAKLSSKLDRIETQDKVVESEDIVEAIEEQTSVEERAAYRIEETTKTLTSSIKDSIANFVDKVKTSFRDLSSRLKKFWDWLPLIVVGISAAVSVVKRLWNFFSSDEGKKWIQDRIEDVTNSIVKLWSDTITPFWNDTVLPFWNDKVEPWLTGKFDEVVDKVWSTIKSNITDFFEGLVRYLAVNLLSGHTKVAKNAEKWLKEHPDNTWSIRAGYERSKALQSNAQNIMEKQRLNLEALRESESSQSTVQIHPITDAQSSVSEVQPEENNFQGVTESEVSEPTQQPEPWLSPQGPQPNQSEPSIVSANTTIHETKVYQYVQGTFLDYK